jgi:hypothetical protein
LFIYPSVSWSRQPVPIFISDFSGGFHFSVCCIIYSFRIG